MVAVTCLMLSGASIAAESKPDIAIDSKSIDISVALKGGIKADPTLAANCLADGSKWIAASRAEADKAYKDAPETFKDRKWTFEREYQDLSDIADRYVSVLLSNYINTGGAHPNRNVDTVLWDRKLKKRISIRPFFADLKDNSAALKAMLKGVIASLVETKKQRDTYFAEDLGWQGYLEPKLLKIGPVSLTPSTVSGKSSGLTFHYAPYAVGAYAEGSYTAFVPWERLSSYLTPEGKAIFGGSRPAGDKDKSE